MTQQQEALTHMMAALAGATQSYLESEMDIAVTAIADADNTPDSLTLDHMTAVIGIGGESGLLATFCFSPELDESLFQRLSLALGLPPDEAKDFRPAGLTEMANVIAGNWIAEFSPPGTRTALTPPVLVEGTKAIPRIPHAIYRTVSIATEAGSLSIYLIGPKNMFDLQLNAA
jgi:CheY-specific phosphatase CheX